MSVKFEGIIPPVVTPFDAEGEIDEAKLRREIQYCLDCGADGARMSGSGPTVYGLFSVKTDAETAVQRLKPRFADTFLTELV